MKKVNNNAAVAVDDHGNRLVVFGKGIGFYVMPYELTDLTLITSSYYNVDNAYINLLAEIPSEVFQVATKIVEAYKSRAEVELNSNLVFILADHLNFAIERFKQRMYVALPYSYDLAAEFPKEYELAQWALKLIEIEVNVRFPRDELTSITMHLVNARMGSSPLRNADLVEQVLVRLTEIIDSFYKVKLNPTDFNYYRFANHVRRFVERKIKNEVFPENQSSLFEYMKNDYPKIFACVMAMDDYLAETFGSHCSKAELVYLMIHVNAFTDKLNVPS